MRCLPMTDEREAKLDLAEPAVEKFLTELHNSGKPYHARELAAVVLDAVEGKPTPGAVQ